MLSQDEANDLLAAFDAGEYSGRIEQALLDGEDRDAVIERLYDRFMDERQEMVSPDDGGHADEWSRLRKLGVRPDHVEAWLHDVWDELSNEVD